MKTHCCRRLGLIKHIRRPPLPVAYEWRSGLYVPLPCPSGKRRYKTGVHYCWCCEVSSPSFCRSPSIPLQRKKCIQLIMKSLVKKENMTGVSVLGKHKWKTQRLIFCNGLSLLSLLFVKNLLVGPWNFICCMTSLTSFLLIDVTLFVVVVYHTVHDTQISSSYQ